MCRSVIVKLYAIRLYDESRKVSLIGLSYACFGRSAKLKFLA